MVAAEAALSTHFTRDGELHLEKYMEQLRCVYFLSGFGRERLFYRSSDKGLFCLVLEDDAVFRFRGRRAGRDVSVSAYLGSIARALPEDCDLCYLGYAANREKQDHYLENQSSMFFVPSYVWQLHGYLLSPRGAAKLLAHLPVNEPVDNFVGRLCYNKKLKVCY
jgi:GR25 family glycosyltransferase involved in LPS biosynthesis